MIPLASQSSYISSETAQLVDIASNSAVAVGIGEIYHILWLMGVFLTLFIGFYFGAWWFRR